jgi:hypothetical protein
MSHQISIRTLLGSWSIDSLSPCVVSDDIAPISIANNYEVSNAIQNSVYPRTTRPLMMSGDPQHSASVVNEIELPNRLHLSPENFTHACEGFSVPPPLVDKKRTGPRCKICSLHVSILHCEIVFI